MGIANQVADLEEENTSLKIRNKELTEQVEELKDDDLITAEEVAELLRTSVGTIYQWVHRKAIPFQKPAGKLLFSRQELKEWRKPDND